MQKTRANPFLRLQRLSRQRQLLLIRAAAILSLASATVALLSFRRAIRFSNIAIGAPPRRRLPIEDCVWAVEAAARRLPWRAVCIEKGLALQRLLRRGGVDARLHYGARLHPITDALEAHVWVTVEGEPVIGGEEASNFSEIAIFP
jgi:hypothetical protein